MLDHRIDKDKNALREKLSESKKIRDKLTKIYNACKDESAAPSDKKNISVVDFKEIFALIILSKSNDINNALGIFNDNDVVKEDGMPMQNYTSKFLAYVLENKRDEFDTLYKAYEKEKKEKWEEAESIYIKMLKAVLDNDEDILHKLYIEAAEKFPKRKKEKFWDDALLEGGGMSNDFAYAYLGTVALCLAKQKGMKVELNDKYNDYYPKEIIEA